MKLRIQSKEYRWIQLDREDVPAVLKLTSDNPQYYSYMPPQATEESILSDMLALPPGKTAGDKYYLGIYREGSLVAVVDLILGYPEEKTAFIGFFMVNAADQFRGVGTALIGILCEGLKQSGFARVRLAYVRDNLQSAAFWNKNGFSPTGETREIRDETVILSEREL